MSRPAAPKANSQKPRGASPPGRMQAAHYEPGRSQKDRRRGYRLKGGRVRLGEKRASRVQGSSGRKQSKSNEGG